MFIFCNGSETKLMFFYFLSLSFLSLFYHLTCPVLIVSIPFSQLSTVRSEVCERTFVDRWHACFDDLWSMFPPISKLTVILSSPVLSSFFLPSLCLGATIAVFEAPGPTSGPVRVWEWEAPEVEGKSGKSRSQTQEGPCHEGASGLQQTHQWKPVYVQPC